MARSSKNTFSLLVVFLVVITISAATILFVGIPLINQLQPTQSTTTFEGYYFQFEELNQSSIMKAGATALFLFNISSPVNGVMYYGVLSSPPPAFHQNITMQNMTSKDLELPSGVRTSYPYGNMLTTQGTAEIEITLSSTVPVGQLELEFMILQEDSPGHIDGQGHGFNLTVLPG